MREVIIQKKVTEYAASKGWSPYKVTSTHKKGFPDYIFIKEGMIFFIEFKSDRMTNLTKTQEKIIKSLQDNKVKVFVINDINKGKELIDCIEGFF